MGRRGGNGWLLAAATFVAATASALVHGRSAPVAASAPSAAALPERLSETGLFLPGTKTVAPDVLAFAPQYPLWSDGATKRRWIRLPKGAVIDGSRPDAWTLPAGTRLWKEIAFGDRGETRMIEHLGGGAVRYATYVWDDAIGDARLAPSEGRRAAFAIAGGAQHDVPGHDDCRACHEGREGRVLGFNALQLSPDRDPQAVHRERPPPDAIDLEGLLRRGLLAGYPSTPKARAPRIAAATPEARAAAGYLFGNCSGCHNARGPLAPLGLDFDQSVLDDDGSARVARAVVGQASRFRIPDAATSVRVAAGHPDASAVAFRMRSRDRASQMPPIGTQLVDDDGVRLVERWIDLLAE